MGTKFEVWSWDLMPSSGEYADNMYWCGESYRKALRMMRKAKKQSGCVKLIWRE